MAFLYPWGNTQQLNLDWILQKIKALETGGGAGADLEEVANALIAITHRSTTQYQRHDYCFYNGKLYRALVNTTGAFAPGDWREVVLGDDVSVLTRLINALDTDNIDNASNVSGNTASDALNNLLTALGDLDSDDIDNASQVTGASVTEALDNLNGAITSLQNVDTAIEKGLAIIVNGDTCSTAVVSGSYAYIKNNTHGLTEGLYRNKTANAFPTSGGTADSTVFEAISSGGLNAISNRTYGQGTRDSTNTQGGVPAYYIKNGVVYLFGYLFVTNRTFSNGDILATNMPEPTGDLQLLMADASNSTVVPVFLEKSTKTIKTEAGFTGAGHYLYFTGSYLLA